MRKKIQRTLRRFYYDLPRVQETLVTEFLATGTLLSNQQWQLTSRNINDYEFRIFSQFGDDGIIQFLTKRLEIPNPSFIEFGVDNYLESNTRFLLFKDNWSGFVIDGSQKAMQSLRDQLWFWQYDLRATTAFIDRENINALLTESQFSNIGLLHIDLDGNDYWILEAIDLSQLNPIILSVEYNSVFGPSRSISVPYDPKFHRTEKHFSNLYWGASLPAFVHLAQSRGYRFIGCTKAGNNAYFVRQDMLNDWVREVSIEQGFVESKHREGRNGDFSYSFARGQERLSAIAGLPVINVVTGDVETV